MDREKEEEIITESYRTALYDMFTAIIKFLSVDDLNWLIPRINNYAESIKRLKQ